MQLLLPSTHPIVSPALHRQSRVANILTSVPNSCPSLPPPSPTQPSSQAITAAKLPSAATAAGKHGRSTSNVPLMPVLPAVATPAGHTRTPSMPGPVPSQAALDPRSVTLSAAEAVAAAQGQPLPQPGSASAAAPAGGLDPLQWLLQVRSPHSLSVSACYSTLHESLHNFIPHTHMSMHGIIFTSRRTLLSHAHVHAYWG